MRRSVRGFFGIGVLLCFLLWPLSVVARIISPWTLERIAKEAEVVVVGEVLHVGTIGSIPADETRWSVSLLRKRAKIRVLRSFAQAGVNAPTNNEEIGLEFFAIDSEKGEPMDNGPSFPSISTGEVTVFPLRRSPSSKEHKWELLDEEDIGLLVPSLRDNPRGRQPESLLDFLRLELAGILSRGTRADIYRAAQYLASAGGRGGESIRALSQLVSEEVKEDEARWLSLAAACYCVSGVPRPKLSDLRGSQEAARPELAFAVEALGRIRGELTVDRFIEESFEHISRNPWGVAVTITVHDRQNPTAVRLLIELLEAGKPEAVFVTQYIVRDAQHPVIPAAVKAAREQISLEYSRKAFGTFRAACELIRDYGSEEDFEFLLAQIAKAKEEDFQKFRAFWSACVYVKNPRLIRIYELFIDDRGDYGKRGWRLCDSAATGLQHLTGEDFGAASGLSVSERDKVVEKAKVWLAANLPTGPIMPEADRLGQSAAQADPVDGTTWLYFVLPIGVLCLASVVGWLLLRRKSG